MNKVALDNPVIIGCAGGMVEYRLIQEYDSSIRMETRSMAPDYDDEDYQWGEWQTLGTFSTPILAWGYIGQKVGWAQ